MDEEIVCSSLKQSKDDTQLAIAYDATESISSSSNQWATTVIEPET
jgi:hypothetical protein